MHELLHTDNLNIKGIISHGGYSGQAGEWYDQDEDEWVMLMQGKAGIEFEGGRVVHMGSGDYLLIHSGERHRVSYTSAQPHCIWLAVHFNKKS